MAMRARAEPGSLASSEYCVSRISPTDLPSNGKIRWPIRTKVVIPGTPAGDALAACCAWLRSATSSYRTSVHYCAHSIIAPTAMVLG